MTNISQPNRAPNGEPRRKIGLTETVLAVFGSMATVFAVLNAVLPISLVQPVAATVFGLTVVIVLMTYFHVSWQQPVITWVMVSGIGVIVYLFITRPAVISGSITDNTGQPQPGLTVILNDSGGVDHKSVTGVKGEFEINNVPEGRYTITVDGKLVLSGNVPSGWSRIFDVKVQTGTLVMSSSLTPTVAALASTPTPTSTSTFTPIPTNTSTSAPTSTFTPPPPQPTCAALIPTHNPISAPPTEGWGRIVTPSNCATDLQGMPQSMEVAGTYSPEFEGKHLWILDYAPNKAYYPQGRTTKQENKCTAQAMDVQRAGRWVTLDYMAASEHHDLVLVVANTTADSIFHDWLINGCQTGSYPGLGEADLPAGLIELDSITVRTK